MNDPFNEDLADYVSCDHCAALFEDGHGNRLGSEYVCDRCFYTHPAVVGDVAAVLAADERSGK